ncbi:hypothetical protein Pyn_01103 [Prunus yedoensis var. nudiflora]|uniref:Uncharacterized protein n=1 Tax=Prunus yedoensis var. nudiflora TaxID=2094558 RepID=A0A314XYU5_PRUYE|nr:hypothetical protein Pyn_01103 [Prunus yedoensis var. nudiflora]
MASSSKTFLLLGFMFALVILISSEVSARELVQNPYKGRPLKPGPVVNCSRQRYSECLPKPKGHAPPAPGPQRVYARPAPGPGRV